MMISTIPAFPVRDLARAVAFYRDRLGFESKAHDDSLGIMVRDEIEIHLWEANDPRKPGAEPYLAGSASCRVRVRGVQALYDEFRAARAIHPNGALRAQPWGESDFTVLDADNNAIAFFEPTADLT